MPPRFRRPFFIIAAPVILLGAAPVEESPDSELLRSRIVEALGGEQRLSSLRTLKLRGSMEGVSGFPGEYEAVFQWPGRRLETWDIGYIRQTTGYDGREGWQSVKGVREVASKELVRLARASRFQPLHEALKGRRSFSVETGSCQDRPTYVLRFEDPAGPETYQVDRQSYLPLCRSRAERFEEGVREVHYEFGDYRRTQGLQLPFRWAERRPDGSLKVSVTSYEINPKIDGGTFSNPLSDKLREPYSVSLKTLPGRVFKQADGAWSTGPQRSWGMFNYGNESFSFDLVVDERHGRFLSPVSAELKLFSGLTLVRTEHLEGGALERMRKYPVTRFSPQKHIYSFRHNLSVPQPLAVDRILYTFIGRAKNGTEHRANLEIPVTIYRPTAKLIFPVKGKAVVTTGHEFYELEHKYEWSQQFGIDIVALGDNFELARNDGLRNEDYVGFATREILAPAAGEVVYARNDVPDGRVKAEYLKMKDGITAIAGNLVIIDHGTGEFSIFCHMQRGSVRVQPGQKVAQGEVIGLMGASGSPGLPHLHYQLQAGPELFGADGLPLIFENLDAAGWLNRGGKIENPRRGVFVIAR